MGEEKETMTCSKAKVLWLRGVCCDHSATKMLHRKMYSKQHQCSITMLKIFNQTLDFDERIIQVENPY